MAPIGEQLQTYVAHSGKVNCVQFGRKTASILATGGDDRLLNVWSVGKPNCLHRLSGHQTAVEAIGFDGNETTVVGGSASGALKLWDLATGKLVRSLSGHKSNIRSIDFHPYGEFIASGSFDTNLKVWDIRRKGCIQAYKGHNDTINCIRFSPDGRWVISGSEDKVIKLWDLTAGKMIQELKEHTGGVTSLEFNPNEYLLASGSSDRTVKFWDLETFQCVSRSTVEASRVRCIAFDNDGRSLYSAAQDSLRVYGWEPFVCHDKMSLPWGKVGDIAPGPSGLMGASISQNMVSIYKVPYDHVSRTGNPRTVERTEATPTAAPPPVAVPTAVASTAAAVPAGDETRKEPTVALAPPVQRSPPAPRRQSDEVATAARSEPAALDEDTRSSTSQETSSAMGSKASRVPPTAALLAARHVAPEPAGTPRAVHTPEVPSPDQGGSQCDTPSVVPAQRDKPMGLNMDAFLPPSSSPALESKSMAESVVLDSIQTGHVSMVKVLATRLRNTQIVRRQWTEGNHKAAVDMLIDLGDQAVLVDVLNVMTQKPKVWNLELSASVLSQLDKLIESPYESYITTASTTVQMIVKAFGQMVLDNVRVPPAAGGIDISREERYERCSQVFKGLRKIKSVAQQRSDEPGKVGSQLRSLSKMLHSFE
eukprot:m.888961 g.888961  ORF g.888961 m.888961 type:complete len:650 (-) comp23641_c0_seq2:1851-3800(-)